MIVPHEPLAWVIVAVAGAVVGRLVIALVAPLVAVDATGRPVPPVVGFGRWFQVAAVLGALALWWWEVVTRAQLPPGEAAAVGDAPLVARYAIHLILFALLAAASWVDLRHRVIPDVITMPGVLAGLACVTLAPGTLLPIVVEVPRSFAPPLLEPDVLGLFGGLQSALPAWLGSQPAWSGLAAALAVFIGWWWGCTAPFLEPPAAADGLPAWLREPRNLALVAGILGITAAWWHGGTGWRGLLTGLAGLVVAAGMIWLTRAGASRALGREAMGLGDVTLMAMVGSWLGWQACVLACFVAVFVGLAHGVLQLIRHRESELPFGPSLCLGAVAVVVAWRPLWGRAAASFERPLEMAAVVVAVIGLTAVSLMVWRRFRPSLG
jgi:prepilin signal peptidase PulO-like enzyme (type II secretory pathway)